MQFERLRDMLTEIDEQEDNLRFYRITEPVKVRVKQYGAFRSVDFEGLCSHEARTPCIGQYAGHSRGL